MNKVVVVTYRAKKEAWRDGVNEYFRCVDEKEAAELFEIYDDYRRKNTNFVKAVKII